MYCSVFITMHSFPTHWESWCIRASVPTALINFICFNSRDVLNCSSYYELIDGIECKLSTTLFLSCCCEQRLSSKLFVYRIKSNTLWDLFVLFELRLPSTHVALQQIWCWSTASRQEPPLSLVPVAMASSRMQSSSPSPRGLYLLTASHTSVMSLGSCFLKCCFLTQLVSCQSKTTSFCLIVSVTFLFFSPSFTSWL